LKRLGTEAKRLCAFAPLREIKNATLFEMKMNFLFSTPTNSQLKQLFSKSVSLFIDKPHRRSIRHNIRSPLKTRF